MKRILILASLLLLIGCELESFSPQKIPIVEYSLEQSQQAARELAAQPQDSMLQLFVLDYGRLRAIVRCSNNFIEFGTKC